MVKIPMVHRSNTSCCRDNTSKQLHKLQTEATQTQIYYIYTDIYIDNGTKNPPRPLLSSSELEW